MNGGRETSSGAAALSALLPEKVEGYAPAGPDRHFTADTLFDLIDGGAEIYRAFNVQRTVHRRYTHAEANDIIADIFDMGSAADACGAYHNDIREGENPGIGRESEYQGGSLSFWKDRYYVSVVAIHESAASARAVRAIGAAVAEAIPGDAAPPALAGLLPEEGLLVEQLYYFHDHHDLARRYRPVGGNPLRLTRETLGLLARYRGPGGGAHGPAPPASLLLLVRYASAEHAAEAGRAFRTALNSGWRDEPAMRIPTGGWAAVLPLDEVLAAALETPDRDEALRLVDAVSEKHRKIGGKP